MKLQSTIKVGNNAELNIERLKIETSCVGFADITIPKGMYGLERDVTIELHRGDLIEFLLRTQPTIPFHLQVCATKEVE